jgi:hypothetical protein
MKAYVYRSAFLVVGTMVLCLPRPSLAASPEGNVHCSDVIQRGVLNILTINILFSEVEHHRSL